MQLYALIKRALAFPHLDLSLLSDESSEQEPLGKALPLCNLGLEQKDPYSLLESSQHSVFQWNLK